MVKNLLARAGDSRDTGLIPGLGRSPSILAPVFLPGKFHGQRSLVGYSPWGCKELDVIECAHSHTHTDTHTPLERVLGISVFSELQRSPPMCSF